LKPIITDICDPGKAFKWTVFHIVLGVLTTVTPYIFILYFYSILFFNLGPAFNGIRRGKPFYFLLMFSYLMSFELIARITKSYPFVPSEYTKYLMLLLGLIALIQSPRKANAIGVALIWLLMPSLFFDFSGMREWYDVVNCWFGAMALAICTAFFGSYSPTDLLIKRILRLMWLPMLAMVVNMFLKTPDLEDIQFSVKAIKSATGGASSNQASTMLGFGMFLTFYSLFTGENFSGRRVIDIAFMLLFAYQGLLTFSRGGMFVGLLSIILLVFSYRSVQQGRGKRMKMKGIGLGKSILFLTIGGLILGGTYLIIDEASGGKLSLRYQGETPGTAAGHAEKDLNRFTSGRSMIFEEDLHVFLEYPLLGGGAGSSIYLREEEFGIAPHIEFTRLLADQGILGLVYFILLLHIGWKSWVSRGRLQMGNVLFILFLIGLLTSFHSAMRTFVTPFLIALSAMGMTVDRNPKTR
jgi:hypothetical protein